MILFCFVLFFAGESVELSEKIEEILLYVSYHFNKMNSVHVSLNYSNTRSKKTKLLTRDERVNRMKLYYSYPLCFNWFPGYLLKKKTVGRNDHIFCFIGSSQDWSNFLLKILNWFCLNSVHEHNNTLVVWLVGRYTTAHWSKGVSKRQSVQKILRRNVL